MAAGVAAALADATGASVAFDAVAAAVDAAAWLCCCLFMSCC